MNRKTTSNDLRPLGADDLAFVKSLATQHSEGLDSRCHSYRRRASVRRYVLAVAIFFGCCLPYSSAMPLKGFEQITSTGGSDSQHICTTIRQVIDNI